MSDIQIKDPVTDSSGFFTGVEDKILMLQQMAGKASSITRSDLSVVRKRAEAMERLIKKEAEVTAKYKIEIHFEKGRTDRDAFVGVMVVFKTGLLSGGGDEIVYPCPNDKCHGYIDFYNRTHTGQTVCPVCGTIWLEDQLSEIRGFKRDINGWASLIAKTFSYLDNSADIFLKTHLGDIRRAAIKETLMERRGEDLYKARDRVVLRYALKAILKDTMGGSSLESRIKGLLRA